MDESLSRALCVGQEVGHTCLSMALSSPGSPKPSLVAHKAFLLPTGISVPRSTSRDQTPGSSSSLEAQATQRSSVAGILSTSLNAGLLLGWQEPTRSCSCTPKGMTPERKVFPSDTLVPGPTTLGASTWGRLQSSLELAGAL